MNASLDRPRIGSPHGEHGSSHVGEDALQHAIVAIERAGAAVGSGASSLATLRDLQSCATEALAEAVARRRNAGWSWARIAGELGISRQRAWQVWGAT